MSSNISPRLRCAIYTRKSSEEGLDQQFNSLDAQREACVAFIASQVGLGWKLIPDRYDDGGISGGTMERPALQRLLQDIRDKKVDVVVVYKIDRLTRSLMDFSRIVEIFDAASVSFVSVTQQFNTTTSMGRLTLNVLLSFAQFEREVTAERIRDKIAASKKKGMWMGGRVSFGYRAEDRKLIMDDKASATVRWMFERYLELRSVTALATEIERSGHMCDPDGGSRRLSRGQVFYMLANPIYIGKLRHHGKILDGEHQPIVDAGLYDRVQAQLSRQAPKRRAASNSNDVHLLTGLVFDQDGMRLKPTHTSNHGKRYRYYVSAPSTQENNDQSRIGWRIPAHVLERIVILKLQTLLTDALLLAGWMQQYAPESSIEAAFQTAEQSSDRLGHDTSGEFSRVAINDFLARIDIASTAISLTARPKIIVDHLVGGIDGIDHPTGGDACRDQEVFQKFELPITIKRRGQEQRIVIDSFLAHRHEQDPALIDLIAKAHFYLNQLTNQPASSITEMAVRLKVHPADISRILPLAFLSPSIANAILTGNHPADLTANHLSRLVDVPASWEEQRSILYRQ